MRRWRPGYGHGDRATVLTEAVSGEPVRLVASVAGRVQGVGFRVWARSRARGHGLTGWARNLPDGRVEVVAEGSREQCERLLADLRSEAVPGVVRAVSVAWQDAQRVSGFRVG